MIYNNTIIPVADNSGANYVKCINNGHGSSSGAGLNELISVLVYKNDNFNNVINSNTVYNAIVINCNSNNTSNNGVSMRWRRTRVLMVSPNLNFLGTSVYGPICKEMSSNVVNNEGTFSGSIVSYAKGSA